MVFNQGGSAGNPQPGRLRVYGLASPLPVITTKLLALGRTGTGYSQALAASAGTPGFSWSLAAGTLPAGLSLAANGTISGTATATGARRITVRVTDAKGRTATAAYTLTVVGGSPGDWTTTGRDATGNAFDPGEATIGLGSAPSLAYRWKTQNPAEGAFNDTTRQPVVVGTRLYDVDRAGELKAWDTAGTATNRAPVWHTPADQTSAGTYFNGAPTYSGGVLYLLDSRGALEAVRASDGVRLWTSSTTSTFGTSQGSAPLVVGTRILVKDYGRGVRAFSTVDGSPLWGGAATVPPRRRRRSGPLSSDGTLAFTKAGCDLYALRLTTGAVAWHTEIVPRRTASCYDYTAGIDAPIVVDGAVYAGTVEASVVVASRADGSVRWRRPPTPPRAGWSSVGVWIVSGNRYDGGSVTAYDATDGDVLWRREGTGISQVSAAGDLVVVRSLATITGLSRLTGEDVWDGGTADPGASTNGAATIAGGRMYISTYGDGVKAYGPLT